jgi:RNA polymerase sigma-70 factor (ECF subfamily)
LHPPPSRGLDPDRAGPRIYLGAKTVPCVAVSFQPAQISDEELLRAIQRGDESALAALYDRYGAILFGLIVRIVNTRPEAEDVLQQVFLQVWNRAANYNETRGRVFSWLVTLARSRAIDRMRSLGVRARAAETAAELQPRSVAHTGESAVLRSEQRELIRKVMDDLSSDQREVLFLAYFEGLTQIEIAERTATPLGTVKTRMRNGLIKLRELLKGQGQDLY